MPRTTIGRLSKEIAENTQKVEEFLLGKGLPAPSLDATAPPYPLPDDTPEEIKEAQVALIEACGELKDLMNGPRAFIRFNVSSSSLSDTMMLTFLQWTAWVSVKAILRFKIDKTFAVKEQTTFEAISQATGLTEKNVTRIIRHAIINHKMFDEPTPGVVVHSGLTAILKKDESVRNSLLFMLDEFWPAGVQVADALQKWPNSEEANETVCKGQSLLNKSNADNLLGVCPCE